MQRTELLVGTENVVRLTQARVLLVGLGGVGSAAAEFLCRGGIGNMTIVDGDVFDVTNKNRQLGALDSTTGHSKSAVVAARLRDINPELQLTEMRRFIGTEEADQLITPGRFDYLVDCIDSVAPKIDLIVAAHGAGVKVVSAMGAGGRMDAGAVRMVDFFTETRNDPFAALLRKMLRRRGVRDGVMAVFCDEPALASSLALTQQRFKRSYYGTISYMPSLFGIHMAAHVIDDVVGGPASRRAAVTAPIARRVRRRAFFREEAAAAASGDPAPAAPAATPECTVDDAHADAGGSGSVLPATSALTGSAGAMHASAWGDSTPGAEEARTGCAAPHAEASTSREPAAEGAAANSAAVGEAAACRAGAEQGVDGLPRAGGERLDAQSSPGHTVGQRDAPARPLRQTHAVALLQGYGFEGADI